jgi:hypothetical protein
MTDLTDLADAFTELERRADAASAGLPPLPLRHTPRPGPRRLLAVAATVAVVAGLAVGAVVLAPGDDGAMQAGAPPVPPSTTGSAPAPAFTIPGTPEELADRFRAVLGDTATFTVTETGAPVVLTAPAAPPASAPGGAGAQSVTALPSATPVGAAIVGMLTAAGVTGGFDLQIYPTTPGEPAWCDDPDLSHCTVRTLADGSSLATAQVPLEGSSNGVTLQANLIRPDGAEFLMHVSNERSPKGASEVLGATPPLTIDQMIAIVTSDRW